MKYYKNILETIGNTPLVKLNEVVETDALVLAKVETFNPGNSINGTLETIIIENPSEGFLSELAISSCEGNVHEIRIYQNILSTGNTWDCGPFGCYNPGTGAGEYTSIESCESICNPTSVICTSVSGDEITSVGFWENPNDQLHQKYLKFLQLY